MGIRVVPFTPDKLNRATAEIPGATLVEIKDEQSYRLLLQSLWNDGEAFTLIEHDVVPTVEQLERLEECPQAWCNYGYCPGDWTPTFGCARFSRSLIADTQGVWDDPTWPWYQLDSRFAVFARARRWRHHWHYPHVLHTRFSQWDKENQEHRGVLSMDLELHFLQAETQALNALLESEHG